MVSNSQRPGQPSALTWLLNALLFALVFSVVPFFTGTQNTYFLYGLHQAGYGMLSQDWLTNTSDSKPFFTLLISLSYRLSGMVGFYIAYLLLLGVYVNSLIYLVNDSFQYFFQKSRLHQLALLALLLLLHSGLLHFYIKEQTGSNWFPEALAQQTVIDHYLQSQSFGVLLLLAMVYYLQRKLYLAVGAACLAATIHISYLLPAALLTLCCMLLSYLKHKNIRKPLSIGLFALLLIAPILLYTLLELMPLSEAGQRILYDFRIRHHANPYFWSLDETGTKLLLMLLVYIIVRRRKALFVLYNTFFICALVLTLLHLVTGSKSIALLFPWRISVILFPLAVSLLMAVPLRWLLLWVERQALRRQYMQWFLYALTAGLLAGGCWVSLQHMQDKTQFTKSVSDVVAHMELDPQSAACILIPDNLEDFRLTAGVPVYVDYKSHPYRDEELQQWYERLLLSRRFYQGQLDDGQMRAWFAEAHIRYILAYQKQPLPAGPNYRPLYEGKRFILYATSVENTAPVKVPEEAVAPVPLQE